MKLPKATILVVEDERIVALDLQNKLTSLGYNVPMILSAGEDVIEKLSEINPDLILMDIMLKGQMDGIETAQHVKDHYNIPVIYMTAYADFNTLQRAKITEPFGYVLKPFEERELRTTIEMALYRYKLEKRLKENEEWLFTTLKSIGDAVIATDDQGLIKFLNPVAENITGWTQQDAMGRPVEEVFVLSKKEGQELRKNPIRTVLAKGETIMTGDDVVLINKNGSMVPIDDSASPIQDATGKILGAVLVFRNMSERKKSEENLKEANELLGALIQASPLAVTYFDNIGNVKTWNTAAENIFGWKAEEVIGKPLPIIPPQEENLALLYRQRIINGDTITNIKSKRIRKDGKLIDVNISASPLHDANGRVQGIVAMFADITEQSKHEQEIQTLTFYDHITGLPNGVSFSIHLEKAMEEAKKSNIIFAVLSIDIDRFKIDGNFLLPKNKNLFIKTIAEKLSSSIRKTDIISHFDSDDFGILLWDVNDVSSVELVVNKITSSICESFIIKKTTVQVTASIGVALFPGNGKTAEELIMNANIAMNMAKSEGGNSYVFYKKGMNKSTLTSGIDI